MFNNIIQTINPATEEILKEYLIADKQHVSSVIDKSKKALDDGWKNNWHKRRDVLHRVSMELKKDKEKLAKVATREMGKPLKEARSEIEKCATTMEFYSYNGEIYLHEESINTDANKSIIKFEPLGVIGSIMPWNFPYWQALRFAAPSMMAGNTIVLKPASNTIQCGLEIEKIFQKAGEAELNGIFQTLIGNYLVAEYLIDSSNIDGITFTGSVKAGAKVAQRATSQLKKCVLELGGSDPFIVCKDADIEKASSGAVKGRFINCGQSCIASKRFFIVKDIADEFIEKFVQKTEKLRIGDPMSEYTDIGPLVNLKSLKNIENLVQDAIDKGSELVTGGEKIGIGVGNKKGFFYKPTILKNVSDSARIAKEETFGPIAPITIVNDEKEAIKLANNSEFGLGASIWTTNLEKAEKLTNLIQAGIVTVNNVVISDPRVPFGGIKKSGFGRELSRYGMLEFVNIKSVRFYDELVINHHVE